jgi:hypothetical protein
MLLEENTDLYMGPETSTKNVVRVLLAVDGWDIDLE